MAIITVNASNLVIIRYRKGPTYVLVYVNLYLK